MRSLLLFAATLLLSCNNTVDHYVLKVRLRSLTLDKIYDRDLVNDILFDAEELDKDSLRRTSHELFLKGIDLFRNKQKVNEGITFLKNSILIYPDAKSYYELGNALAETGTKSGLTEALSAFNIAEDLRFNPVSYVLVRKAAVANSIAEMGHEDKEQFRNDAVYYLRLAFEKGLNDTMLLNKEARLQSIITGPEYRKLMLHANLGQPSSGPTGVLKLFIESFPEPVSEFEITADNVDVTRDAEHVNYEFADYIPEMENASFGRDVTRDFFYVTRLKGNENYNAVVYSSVTFMGEFMQPVHTTLATFDNSGKVISRKLISCQCSAEKIRTVSYKNNELKLEDHKRIWEKPITEVGFDDNKIIKVEKLSEAIYSINEQGEITEQSVTGSFKDPI